MNQNAEAREMVHADGSKDGDAAGRKGAVESSDSDEDESEEFKKLWERVEKVLQEYYLSRFAMVACKRFLSFLTERSVAWSGWNLCVHMWISKRDDVSRNMQMGAVDGRRAKHTPDTNQGLASSPHKLTQTCKATVTMAGHRPPPCSPFHLSTALQIYICADAMTCRWGARM
jgi:hypothetical protein